MDSIQGNKLHPSSLQQLDLKQTKFKTDEHLPDGGIMPQVLSTGMNSWSLGWHIQSSPSKKKYRLFQFLFELGVSHDNLKTTSLLGSCTFPLTGWSQMDGSSGRIPPPSSYVPPLKELHTRLPWQEKPSRRLERLGWRPAKILEEATVKSLKWEPKSRFQHLLIHSNIINPPIVAFFRFVW